MDEMLLNGSSCLLHNEGMAADLPVGNSPFTIEAWIRPAPDPSWRADQSICSGNAQDYGSGCGSGSADCGSGESGGGWAAQRRRLEQGDTPSPQPSPSPLIGSMYGGIVSWGTLANSSSSKRGSPLYENSLGLLGFNGVVHSLGNLDMAMGCAAHGSHGISGTPR